MGAWIEIKFGLRRVNHSVIVAPLVGAWIEIILLAVITTTLCVAPLVGAWIEIVIAVFTCGGT